MPPNYPQILQTKQELESVQNEVEIARKIFEDTNTSYRDNSFQVFEKIAFYAVGSISLSITYVGYVLSQQTEVLKVSVFYLPLYDYLFISWAFLVLSLFTTLFVRWTDITHTFWASQKEYYKAKKKKEEKKISFFQSYPNIVFQDGKSKDTETAICGENVKKYTDVLIPTTERYEKRSSSLGRIIRYMAISSFVMGIVSLVFFATWTVYLRIL